MVNQDGVRRTALDLLGQSDRPVAEVIRTWPELGTLDPYVVEQLATEARYYGYLARQEADIRAFRRDEGLVLPADLEPGEIGGLSTEIRSLLRGRRPATLGAASRLPGMTPAGLTALLGHVRRRSTSA